MTTKNFPHIKLDKKSRLLVVSNRLPFYRTKSEKGRNVWKQASGGLVSALDPVLRETNGLWLGWDGSFQKPKKNIDLNLREIASIKAEGEIKEQGNYSIGNIPLTEDEVEQYYNRFSNGILWALFHYFFENCKIDYNSWKIYKNINKRFAEYIVKALKPNDIIWLQDFHLFLVPYYLRKMGVKQKIHFFLHIPFPHIDIFSIIPWKNKIIESILCCNSFGFHHAQYKKNAVEACKRYEAKYQRDIPKASKNVKTNFFVNPISINFNRFSETAKKPSVIEAAKKIKEQCHAEKLIVGVDRMDYSKGIKERIMAIDFMLERNPHLREKFCYYQLAVPSREEIGAYKTLKKDIDEMVGRVNGKYSTGLWYPIHYIYSSMPFEDLIALYLSADVGLVTPLRDGMNLVCKEYIASHADGKGVLILSKFAGAIAEIKNCLPVNPYSIEDIAQAISYSLHMSEKESKLLMTRMRKNVAKNDISAWLSRCFDYFEKS